MINSKDAKHNRKHLIKARAKTYSTGERNKAIFVRLNEYLMIQLQSNKCAIADNERVLQFGIYRLVRLIMTDILSTSDFLYLKYTLSFLEEDSVVQIFSYHNSNS